VHPEILHWGVLRITSYGLMLAIAFLVGTWLALRESRRLGLDEDQVVTVILVALVAGVVGARTLYVAEHLRDFRGTYLSVLALWQGGLTLYGGIVAGTVAGLFVARRTGLPMWVTADALAPSLVLGTVFGRVGCFLNGCCYGHPTRLPWGVVFPADSFAGLEFGPAPVHPAQLYFAAAGLVLFVLGWLVRRRMRVPGVLFWSLIALLALVRIPLDLTRVYEAEAVILELGVVRISESQVTSTALLLFALLMIARLRRESRPAAAPVAPLP
jgi:phosphatidylglycerol---prolipoprotein diacylglyceryl transferase